MTRALLFGLAFAALAVPAGAVAPSRDSSSHSTSQSSRSSSSGQSSHTTSPPARPAPQPVRTTATTGLGGAPIPGLCMLSQSAVLSNAKVALAADARLKQLAQQADVELKSEQTALDGEARSLEAQRAALSPADLQKRQAALQARIQAWRQKSQQRAREIAATRQKAIGRIATEAQPVIAQAYRAHGCSLLIDRNAVLLGNMSGDLTAEVTRGLDAKITTISFNRENLPPQ